MLIIPTTKEILPSYLVKTVTIRCLSHSTKTIVNKKLFDNSKLKAKDDRKIFGRKKSNEVASTAPTTKPLNTITNFNTIPYITELPKIPSHQQTKSFEEIFKELGQSNIFQEQIKPATKGINLIIPKEFIKPEIQTPPRHKLEKSKDLDKKIKNFIISNQTTTEQKEKDKNLIMLGKEISSQMEPDQNEIYSYLQHPIKKSLSGLKILNPGLQNINDNYLWDIIPEDKLVCTPPYQTDDPLGFKKFNENFIQNQTKEASEKDSILKEVQEFEKLMGNSTTFIQNNGSRRKLNRKLLKNFKKLKD
ncbi:hypothetical protein KGF54_002509 [Candida jiufengensis]|uniref:uncharacterized protein n=1 Tax=Candida jiufengensis TaxID=497108 RepID=UPI00222573C7|nr:uncharacterized protein KGF54_002509 [Candida jiufengensis]KAI5953138.1 hypothetical protein KGF54_002509 [Candida jiufengensis]